MIRRVWGRITEFLATTGNQISRTVRVVTHRLSHRWNRNPDSDWSRPDYAFWRRAYYCRVRGLELSGLFIKPLVNKLAAWTLGRAPHWKLDHEPSQEALTNWWADHHAQILDAFRGALKQGDQFLVVNPDLTLTLVQPDKADPLVSEDDFSQVEGWRFTQVWQHPLDTRRMTMIDEFRANTRTRTIEVDGVERSREVFPNLLGRIPVVHIANQPDDTGIFGHAEAEALVELLHRYNLILEAGVEGNEIQGRPTPVVTFENVEDHDKFWDLYGETEKQTLPNGDVEEFTVLSVDLNQILTLVNADFKYEAPGSFSEDTLRLLEVMFYLLLEHAEIPEFVFGNAIASSKASAETQMPVLVKYIEMRQGMITGWLTELAEIVLGYLALVQPGIVAATPTLQWEELSDQEGNLTLETLKWAYAEGLLDRKTALMLAPVEVEDIDAVLEAAAQEAEERRAAFADAFGQQMDDEIENEESEPENLPAAQRTNGRQPVTA